MKTNPVKAAMAAAILAPALLLSSISHGQERQLTYIEADEVDAASIERAFAEGETAARQLSVVSGASQVTTVTQVSVAVPVVFKIGSARLSQQSQQVLQAVAAAMNSQSLQSADFFVEGHTDASGSVQLNLKLSQKRADAVKAYLVQQGVDAARLTTVGYGEAMLLKGYAPENARHRRVEFVRR